MTPERIIPMIPATTEIVRTVLSLKALLCSGMKIVSSGFTVKISPFSRWSLSESSITLSFFRLLIRILSVSAFAFGPPETEKSLIKFVPMGT